MVKQILFSSGYDSVMVAHQLCESTSRDEEIKLILIDHQNLGDNQYKLQLKKAIQFVKEMQKTNTINLYKIRVKGDLDSNAEEGWSQQLWWVLYSMDYIEGNSEIFYGYHTGDQFWTIEREVEEISRCVKKIRGIDFEVKYPLRMKEKDTIIGYIQENNLEKFCITCEDPVKDKPCEKCNKCIELNVYKYKMKLEKKLKIEKPL